MALSRRQYILSPADIPVYYKHTSILSHIFMNLKELLRICHLFLTI